MHCTPTPITGTQTRACERVLEGHTNLIICLAVLPNGKVVSTSGDNTLRVWDPEVRPLCCVCMPMHCDAASSRRCTLCDCPILSTARVITELSGCALLAWGSFVYPLHSHPHWHADGGLRARP